MAHNFICWISECTLTPPLFSNPGQNKLLIFTICRWRSIKRTDGFLVMLLGAKENTRDKMCKTWCYPQPFCWSRLKYCTKAVKEKIRLGSPVQWIGSFADSLTMSCIIGGASPPSLFVCATLDSNVLLNLMHVVPMLFAPQPTPFCSSLKDNQINCLKFKTSENKLTLALWYLVFKRFLCCTICSLQFLSLVPPHSLNGLISL